MSGVTRAIVGMSAMPLDLADSPWIAKKCWPSAAGFLRNQASMHGQPKQSKGGITGIQYHFGPGPRKQGLIDPHVPSSPLTDTCIPQNNHSTSNTISVLAVSDLLRLFNKGRFRLYSYVFQSLDQSDAGGHG